jgi:hypothetical protein
VLLLCSVLVEQFHAAFSLLCCVAGIETQLCNRMLYQAIHIHSMIAKGRKSVCFRELRNIKEGFTERKKSFSTFKQSL